MRQLPGARFRFVLAILVSFSPIALWAHGHGHVMGTVTSLAASRLEIKTADGKTVSVPINEKTKYLRGKAAVRFQDVKVGTRVSIHKAADGSAMEVRLPSDTKIVRQNP